MPGPFVPMTPALLVVLAEWVSRQRWYAGKGRSPVLTRIGGVRLEDPAAEVAISIHLLLDESGGTPTTYQVPLTFRTDRLAGGDHALVATVDNGQHDARYLYDAPHDPVFAAALLRLMLEEGTAEPDGTNGANGANGAEGPPGEHHCDGLAQGRRLAKGVLGELLAARVLVGEQSNTSIIFKLVDDQGAPSKPLICKLFRVLQPGENPDVVMPSALSAAGSTRVPDSVGYVLGQWSDGNASDGLAAGHLAFAQEFLPGVEDAWRVALAAVASGTDFSEQARSLGLVTAEVHATLARTMGTREATQADAVALTRSMRARHAAALTEVPTLAAFDQQILASIEAVSTADWPALQRIHGDYHLGQVLDAPGRGWVLVDFEGEPLRPLAERSQPELALRDVAGMLRSFDYVAGSWDQGHPGHSGHPDSSAAQWADRARAAFLQGYTTGAGRDPREDAVLLNALELDKALYEVVYEARNRPSWLSIPTAAIARLSAGPRSDLPS